MFCAVDGRPMSSDAMFVNFHYQFMIMSPTSWRNKHRYVYLPKCCRQSFRRHNGGRFYDSLWRRHQSFSCPFSVAIWHLFHSRVNSKNHCDAVPIESLPAHFSQLGWIVLWRNWASDAARICLCKIGSNEWMKSSLLSRCDITSTIVTPLGVCIDSLLWANTCFRTTIISYFSNRHFYRFMTS